MTELSRMSGCIAAMHSLASQAQRFANAANSESDLREAAKKIRAWGGMLALAASAGVGAHAQQLTSTAASGDIFESGGGAPVYSDTFESGCKNTSIFKGMNPLVCHGTAGTVDKSGICEPGQGGEKLWKQVGGQCLYCDPIVPPLTNYIIIPQDDLGAAEAQGFKCGGDEADTCMVMCQYDGPGSGKFQPPPGTKLEGAPGVPQPPNVMAQIPPDSQSGPVNFPCFNLKVVSRPEFTPAQESLLTKDVAGAKAMVAMAKKFTDKNPWDSGTQDISKKYYGNATPATQQTIRQDVNNVLNVLNSMTDVTDGLYPSGADVNGTPVKAGYIAYVPLPQGVDSKTQIFLGNSFWDQPLTGPTSQAMDLIHEVSHLPSGANTKDYAYTLTGCTALVWLTTDSTAKAAPGWSQIKLTENAPPMKETAPLENADTFKWFVYDVASQK
jgi:hypothetical protein